MRRPPQTGLLPVPLAVGWRSVRAALSTLQGRSRPPARGGEGRYGKRAVTYRYTYRYTYCYTHRYTRGCTCRYTYRYTYRWTYHCIYRYAYHYTYRYTYLLEEGRGPPLEELMLHANHRAEHLM